MLRHLGTMIGIDPKQLVRAIIGEMRAQGVAPTRTRVTKFLYLADLQHARFHSGRSLTGWRWYVHHFGPFATEALALLDQGVREGWLRQWSTGEEDDDLDSRAIGYDLNLSGSDLPRLPPHLGQVRTWMKRFGDETNLLLHFVYGSTEPMEGASPGEVLDFGRAKPPGPGEPIQRPPMKKADIKRARGLVAALRSEFVAAKEASAAQGEGPRDEQYFDGLPSEDELPSGEFELTFPRPGR